MIIYLLETGRECCIENVNRLELVPSDNIDKRILKLLDCCLDSIQKKQPSVRTLLSLNIFEDLNQKKIFQLIPEYYTKIGKDLNCPDPQLTIDDWSLVDSPKQIKSLDCISDILDVVN